MPSWHPPDSGSESVQDDESIINVHNDARKRLAGYGHMEEKEKEKSVGEKTRENSSTDNKDGKRIRPGAQMIATHDYKKNPESPFGNELDVNEGDTLVGPILDDEREQRALVARRGW